MKSVEERVQECINIRSQLQSLGILTIHTIKEKLAHHMNDYIKYGDSTSFKLKVPEGGAMFEVNLVGSEGKKSGVIMHE